MTGFKKDIELPDQTSYRVAALESCLFKAGSGAGVPIAIYSALAGRYAAVLAALGGIAVAEGCDYFSRAPFTRLLLSSRNLLLARAMQGKGLGLEALDNHQRLSTMRHQIGEAGYTARLAGMFVGTAAFTEAVSEESSATDHGPAALLVILAAMVAGRAYCMARKRLVNRKAKKPHDHHL